MEYEHQPSGVRQPGQDTDATKRQECANDAPISSDGIT